MPNARYLGRWVNGSRLTGIGVTGWSDAKVSPKLANRDLFDPQRPIRWLIDNSFAAAGAGRIVGRIRRGRYHSRTRGSVPRWYGIGQGASRAASGAGAVWFPGSSRLVGAGRVASDPSLAPANRLATCGRRLLPKNPFLPRWAPPRISFSPIQRQFRTGAPRRRDSGGTDGRYCGVAPGLGRSLGRLFCATRRTGAGRIGPPGASGNRVGSAPHEHHGAV